MEEKSLCPICGKPSSQYMGYPRKDKLCREHKKQLEAGEIALCPDCGKWFNVKEGCECKKKQQTYTELPKKGFDKCVICGKETKGTAFCKDCYKQADKQEMLDHLNGINTIKIVPCPLCGKPLLSVARVCYECNKVLPNAKPFNLGFKITNKETKQENTIQKTTEEIKVINLEEKKLELKKGKCLTCNNETLGDYLFCTECYHKYKNKHILLEVDKCISVTLKDESYEGILECDDGHIVKSMAEREIDNYLNDNNIKHFYEVPFDAGLNKKPIKPDFTLPDYLGEGRDVIIEYWGFDESYKEYTERKKYKLNIYKEQKATVVCLSSKNDLKNIKFALKTKLNKANIKLHKINE